MKIVFVCQEYESLGVEYLSACLKKAGHRVDLIFDPHLLASYLPETHPLRRPLATRRMVVTKVLQGGYGLVCFSVPSDYYGWACGIAGELKKGDPQLPIVFGGVHVTAVPELVIAEPSVDYACVGEGEEAIVELAGRLEGKEDPTRVKNIWAKKDGRIIKNTPRPLVQDLDSLPFPDKEVFFNAYRGFSESYMTMASRGCPYLCSYCFNSTMTDIYNGAWGRVRRRSVPLLIEELTAGVRRYRPRLVFFVDDVFTSDEKWLEAFSAAYARHVPVPYFVFTHPSLITERSVALLKESGCSTVSLGIQTADADLREKVLFRRESNAQIEKAITLLERAGIFLQTTSIFGLPGQGVDSMLADADFFNRNRVDFPSVYWLRYYPRTKICDVAVSRGAKSASEMRRLEEGKDCLPFSVKSTTFHKEGAKIRNLIYVNMLLPQRAGAFMIRHRLHRFIPAAGWFYFPMVALLRFSRDQRKRCYTPFQLLFAIKFNLFFMFRILFMRSLCSTRRGLSSLKTRSPLPGVPVKR